MRGRFLLNRQNLRPRPLFVEASLPLGLGKALEFIPSVSSIVSGTVYLQRLMLDPIPNSYRAA